MIRANISNRWAQAKLSLPIFPGRSDDRAIAYGVTNRNLQYITYTSKHVTAVVRFGPVRHVYRKPADTCTRTQVYPELRSCLTGNLTVVLMIQCT